MSFDITFKTQPYAHQLHALAQFSHARAWALLAEMGTGKTWVLINDYALAVVGGRVQNLLVIAPNGVQWNWVNTELPKHLPDEVAKVALWAGYSGNMRAKARDQLKLMLANKRNGPSILCTSWNSLSNAAGRKVVYDFLDSGVPTMVVLDESDYCKNPSTQYAKQVLKIAHIAAYRRIATGTPITNSPFDAWVQFQFLDPRILKCPSYVAFKRRHGVFLPNAHPLVRALAMRGGRAPLIQAKGKDGRPLYQNLRALSEAIAPYSFRVTKAACLDLPPKTYKVEYVELTKAQLEYYKGCEKACIAVLNDKVCPLSNKLAAMVQMARCTGNHGIEGAVLDHAANPKLERCLELLTSITSSGNKAIVWCRYVDEIKDIVAACDKVGISTVTYYGANSTAERDNMLALWHAGRASVFISNPQCGGTGLTLNEASYVIYYSNSFSLHDRLQSEDRCHRIGQRSNVQYIDLVARGTIDEYISKALANKVDVAAQVTVALTGH